MKQSKLIIILFVVLIAGGWLTALFSSDLGEKGEYKEYLKQAEMYNERGLYQKAIQEYEKAIEIEDDEGVRTKIMKAYENRYKESPAIHSDYVLAAESAVSAYPKNAKFLLTLANLYLSSEDYKEAYSALSKGVDNGIKDEAVVSLLDKVQYAYDLNWDGYAQFRPCINGTYAVQETELWQYISESGAAAESDLMELKLAAAVGEDGVRVIVNDKRGELIDSEGIVQGILDFVPQDAGVYSGGLVAIYDGTSYAYYNSLGDKQFGDYEAAGTYVEGEAAVKKNGKWYIIDEKGKKARDTVYEDIVLNHDGTHVKDGIMIAKKDGVYSIFHEKKVYGAFDDADLLTEDGLIAVCKDGKWGFVDTKGEFVIKPHYKVAKSFSNGLAAVSDGQLWGFIDIDGKMVIDYTFTGADYFNGEKCCMVKTGVDVWQILYFLVME